MALKTLGLQKIMLDLNTKIHNTYYSSNADIKTRGLEVHIIKSGMAFNCTGVTIKLYVKDSGKNIYESLSEGIGNSTGIYEIFYPEGMKTGDATGEIILSNETERIGSYQLSIKVINSLISDASIVQAPGVGILYEVIQNEPARVAAEQHRSDTFDELVETGVLQTNINNKLLELETTYAPRLTTVETELAEITNSTVEKETAPLGAELLDASGWTPTGWTGAFATGFIHAVGQTGTLTKAMTSTGTKTFLVEFTITSPTSKSNVTVAIGGSAPFDIYVGGGTTTVYRVAVKSISDGNLVFSPESTFDGTISSISAKEVTGTYDAPFTLRDSDGYVVSETRPTKADLYNFFTGLNAGRSNISGKENVGIGASALSKNVSGFWNVAVGIGSLQSNIGGSRDIAIGYASLNNNISGLRCVAIGSFSLAANTIGNEIIAIGADSMFRNVSGSGSVGIGFSALVNNTTGSDNIGIGRNSNGGNTTGSNNIGIGIGTLGTNQTSGDNIAIGYSSLSKTTALGNIGIGRLTLYQNSSGIYNVAIGYEAGKGSANGAYKYNVLLGAQAGQSLTTGADSNTIIGFQAGTTLTTGHDNILIGKGVVTSAVDTSNFLNIGNVIMGSITDQKIGIGVTTPTATLHLKAGTSAVGGAPLKLTSGTLLSVTEIGAIEFDGSHLYFVRGDGVRKQLAEVA